MTGAPLSPIENGRLAPWLVRIRRELMWLVKTPGNAIVSALMIALASLIIPKLWAWSITDATWSATDRGACSGGGACWIFIRARLNELLYGGYPAGQTWRVDVCAATLFALVGLSAWPANPFRRATIIALVVALPPLALLLLRGGFAGLSLTETRLWGGLLLNFVLTFLAVVIGVPLGLLLAE